MSDFIPILLTFLAGFFAIFGDTWDATKRSIIGKITVSGWLVLLTLVVSTLWSGYTTFSSNNEKDRRERDISFIIKNEVEESIEDILRPFKLLYMDSNGGNYVSDDEITLSLLLEPENIEKSQDVCLEMRPENIFSIPDGGTWNKIFTSGITAGVKRLERLQSLYSTHMDSNLLRSIHLLLEEGSMTSFARYKPEAPKKNISALPECLASQAIDSHKQYLEMISAVEKAKDSKVFSSQR